MSAEGFHVDFNTSSSSRGYADYEAPVKPKKEQVENSNIFGGASGAYTAQALKENSIWV